MKKRVRVYTDYKSPYAYVANRSLFELERTHDVELEWLPYTLRIAEYLGSVEDRSPHDWRKVRYAYKDARRFANEQGLVLKGPRRIYDGTLSSAGMLFAQRDGFFRAYHDTVFERFWSHRLDIDLLNEMSDLIAEVGGDAGAFEAYAQGPARGEVAAITAEAESLGVFGVPSMLFDGELFWGGDRIDALARRLQPQSRP
ncbi:MAG: disulfide bond formation protein DsbA [Caulobacteraceae bacterium]|jgi:2-hydroxychromene-2-carboxylate isomerase|nr:disulfide bond formation protein DsbA [Caulobacteraceae bacterium]